MRLYTDDYFVIGGQHVIDGKPCQDHTLSGTLPGGGAFAVLADGCSSGQLTDIGARIATTAARTAILNHWNATGDASSAVPQEIDLQQRVILSSVRATLGLSADDMLATTLWAYVSPKGGLVHVRGDGIVALVYEYGESFGVDRFEWANNAPLYPAYAEDEFKRFSAFHGGDDAPAFTRQMAHWVPGEEPQVIATETYTVKQGIAGITIKLDAESMEGLSCIALMSDGAAQVDNLDWLDAASRLVAFKNTEGAFVKRRVTRFLKDAHKVGDGPIDDLSMAVIGIDHVQEE